MNSFKKNIYRTAEDNGIIPPPVLRNVSFVLTRNNALGTNTTALLHNNTKGTDYSVSMSSGSTYNDVTAENFAEAGDNITVEFNNEDDAYISSQYSSNFRADSIPSISYTGSGLWSADNQAGTNHQGGTYPTSCPFSTQSHTATGVAYMFVTYNFIMPTAEPKFFVDFNVV